MVSLLLPPEKKSELHASVARQDRKRATEILAEAVAPTVDAMIKAHKKRRADFESVLQELDCLMDEIFGPEGPPQLPDEAFTRAGIYRDHL
jgi:hypothetical protein